MRIYPSFQIRWYHIVLGILGIGVVLFAVLYIFFDRRRLNGFVEDETDIVDAA